MNCFIRQSTIKTLETLNKHYNKLVTHTNLESMTFKPIHLKTGITNLRNSLRNFQAQNREKLRNWQPGKNLSFL